MLNHLQPEKPKTVKVLLVLINCLYLGFFDIKAGKVTIHKLWFKINILRITFIYIPTISVMVIDDFYFKIYKKLDDVGSFTSTTRVNFLYRILYVIEWFSVIFLNLYIFYKKDEILIFLNKINKFSMTDKNFSKIIRRIQVNLIIPVFITIFYSLQSLQLFNTDSYLVFQFYGFFIDLATSTFLIIFFVCKVFEIFISTVIDQINEEFTSDFSTQSHHIENMRIYLTDLFTDFKGIFGILIHVSVVRTSIYQVLDVSSVTRSTK